MNIFSIISFGEGGWGQSLLAATFMTIAVAVCGYLLGAVIGIVVAWGKISGGWTVRILADAYTTVLRGVPDLLVIFLIYFGGSALVTAVGRMFGAQGFVGFPNFIAGTVAIGICCGAHHTEVFRGAFKAVNPGEIEAAKSCGMNRWLRFRRIIAPLTFRYSIAGLSNVWLVVLKESALVSVVGLTELMRQSQIGAGSTGLPFDFYLVAAIIYLFISSASSAILHWAQLRAMRSVRRA
jgi:octopine/nopaline transport system permease protein